MKILHINTSDSSETTVSLQDGENTVTMREKTGEQKSQNVLPLIEKILHKTKQQLSDLKAIEVHTGPGSFTGVRVGVAVANTLAFVLQIPINGQKPPVAPRYGPSKWERKII